VVLTAGNINDCTMFIRVLAGIRTPAPSVAGPGSPSPSTGRQGRQQHRAIATRYDKTATSYQGVIDLATLPMCFEDPLWGASSESVVVTC